MTRELHHYLIKSKSSRCSILPVYIHHNKSIDVTSLKRIGKYIEVNIDFIEQTNKKIETSLITFRDSCISPLELHQIEDDDDFSIHFTTKTRSKFYTTVLYDGIVNGVDSGSNRILTSKTIHLCTFELYLFIIFF